MKKAKQSQQTQQSQKHHHWHIILLSIIAIIILAFVILYAIIPTTTKTILERLIVSFQNSRAFLFVILLPLCFISLCLALFKKPRKWVYFGFFISLTVVIAVAGQIIDYVTRSSVATHFKDFGGTDFSDYGLTMPDEDIRESYYNTPH